MALKEKPNIYDALKTLNLTANKLNETLNGIEGNWEEKTKGAHKLFKTAQRSQLRIYHPDICKEVNAEQKSKEVNAAADFLLSLRFYPKSSVTFMPGARPAQPYSPSSAVSTSFTPDMSSMGAMGQAFERIFNDLLREVQSRDFHNVSRVSFKGANRRSTSNSASNIFIIDEVEECYEGPQDFTRPWQKEEKYKKRYNQKKSKNWKPEE